MTQGTPEEKSKYRVKEPKRRSNFIQHLLVCMHLQDDIKTITDMAFDTVDEDGSGDLDHIELSKIMQQVSIEMGVNPPSEDDLKQILKELDDDYDGLVSKSEFLQLVMMVIGKMLESEEDL